MKRWSKEAWGRRGAGWLALLFSLGVLSGCGQPTFMAKEVYTDAHTNLLPRALEEKAPADVSPLIDATKSPPTVPHPERPPRYLSLQEAIAIALENGSPGAPVVPGGLIAQAQYTLGQFNGPGTMNNQTDRIRVLALNPALAGLSMEASEARFDAVWVTSMSWTTTDSLAGVPNYPGYLGSVAANSAQFQSSIVKAFSSGAVANVSAFMDYRNLNLNAQNPLSGLPVINPIWAPRLSFGIEQPLWRDWGVEINDLLGRLSPITGNSLTSISAQTGYNNHQGTASNLSDRGPVEGILISRLRFDQSRAEFERSCHLLMVNLEIAYWNLYNKYGQLYSYEENLRILRKAWEESFSAYKVGRIGPEVYYQILGQFEEFRGNRTQGMQDVLEAERNLRGIMGMPIEDGERLVPVTPPTLVEMQPDWESCVHDALNQRPELILARENLKYHQYLLQIQKNNLKPDLRAYAKYEPFGDGDTLQGNGTYADGGNPPTLQSANALRSLASGHLGDYQVGMYLNVPIGFRSELASIRAAKLELVQSYYFLHDQEERAIRYLATEYQEVAHWYTMIQANRAERMAYQQSLKTLDEKIKAGVINIAGTTAGATTVQVLQIQRSYAAALVKEYLAMASYNGALAQLEYAKGTILRYNNVHISEGALPQCAQVRATEYEKDRTQRGIILRQAPDALAQPGRLVSAKESDVLSTPLSPQPGTLTPANSAPLPGDFNLTLPRKFDDKQAPPQDTKTEAIPQKMPQGLPPAPPPTSGPALSSSSASPQSGTSAVVTLETSGPDLGATPPAAMMPAVTDSFTQPARPLEWRTSQTRPAGQ